MSSFDASNIERLARSVNEMAIHICDEHAEPFLPREAPTAGFISRCQAGRLIEPDDLFFPSPPVGEGDATRRMRGSLGVRDARDSSAERTPHPARRFAIADAKHRRS
jgi:hypothetical protein